MPGRADAMTSGAAVAGDPGAPDLARLFAPRSVALVGATDHPTSFGGRVFRQMTGFGYPGRIFAVNPRLKEIFGVPCFPGVKDLPETPDHVGITVAAERVFDVLAECAARGVPFATVYTGGFAEMGTPEGRARQQRLVDFARATGMRIMGPNCNGVINFVDVFAMTSTAAVKGPRAPAGNVGVVSHSGGFGQINVMWRAQQAGLGISYQASCGNEADIDSLDFARFMLRSEATTVLLMAIEGIRDGTRFKALAREAAERNKPIVMLKSGRTAAGMRAAASHTGAIAGDDDIYDAVIRQYGVIRVRECDELYETAILLSRRCWPRGRGAAAVSPTGGNNVQVADAGERFGIGWPAYAAQTQATLAELLPGYGQMSNPTDMTSLATGDQALYRRALAAIAADPGVDTVVPIYASVSRADLQRGADFVAQCDRTAAMLWIGGCTDEPGFTAADLIRSGVPVYRDATSCMRAVRAAFDFGSHVEALRRGDLVPARPAGIDRDAAAARLAQCGDRLTEREGRHVLAAYGLPVMREALATTAADAARIAAEVGGPVALKIDSPDIAHKTESGAMRLGVSGDAAVRAAFDEVIAAARGPPPGARINGVLVQAMVPRGVELMVGALRDPVFGPVVAAGLGGIYVEVLRDIAWRAAPVTPGEAGAMLDELRSRKLLDGVRGMPPRDRTAIVDLIVRVSWFVHDFADHLTELDINPLVVLGEGEGVRVVDALLVRAPAPV